MIDLDEELEHIVRHRVNQRVFEFEQDFISNVSHELRTPITCIKLAVLRLKEEKDESKRKIYLDILETQTQRQIDYINELLNCKARFMI